jgi:hypothetical protein
LYDNDNRGLARARASFFLKIDVEVYEADVFEGATTMLAGIRPRRILMEYRPEQINLAK